MKLYREQKGFTLIEVMIAMSITALITSVIGTAIFQILDRSASGQDTLRALNDIQNAGRWIYLDGEKAQSTDLINEALPVNSMTFSWTADGQPHTVSYSLANSALIRNHNGVQTTAARYIAVAEFSISNNLITIDLTSSPGSSGVSKVVTYKLWVRPYN